MRAREGVRGCVAWTYCSRKAKGVVCRIMRELSFDVPATITLPRPYFLDTAYGLMAAEPTRVLAYAAIAERGPLSAGEVCESIDLLPGTKSAPRPTLATISSHCSTLVSANLLINIRGREPGAPRTYGMPTSRTFLLCGLGAASQVGLWHAQYPGYGPACFGATAAEARKQIGYYGRILDNPGQTLNARAIGKWLELDWWTALPYLRSVIGMGILKMAANDGDADKIKPVTQLGIGSRYLPALVDFFERRRVARNRAQFHERALRALDVLDVAATLLTSTPSIRHPEVPSPGKPAKPWAAPKKAVAPKTAPQTLPPTPKPEPKPKSEPEPKAAPAHTLLEGMVARPFWYAYSFRNSKPPQPWSPAKTLRQYASRKPAPFRTHDEESAAAHGGNQPPRDQ